MSQSSYEELWNNEMQKFHRTLFDEKNHQLKSEFREDVDCPLCHGSRRGSSFQKDDFHYHRCADCELVYMSPRLNEAATLGFYNSELNRIYNINKFDAHDGNSADDLINYENLAVLRQFIGAERSRRLLEIGCAKGNFLAQAEKQGFAVDGVELNRKNAEIAQRKIQGKIHTQDLFQLALPAASYDVVYGRDLIEHIHNSDEFMREVARLLRPGGFILFETHNIDSLVNRIVKEKHTVIFGFEHPVHWSPKTLTRALARHGVITKSVHFQSRDASLKCLLKYQRASTFTTVNSWRTTGVKLFLIKGALKLLSLPVIRQLDDALLPALANFLGMGSTMKLVAQKPL